jgi:toxin ParE1/3/4
LTGRLLRRHSLADKDIIDAIDFYNDALAYQASTRFLDSIEKALRFILAFPKAGSSRLGEMVGLKQFKTWPLTKFPFLVVYLVENEEIDVVRLIHQKRDFSESLPAESRSSD